MNKNMKYCNLDCKHINASIIERCGEGIGYEFRCMAQKGMPKVTTDTFCPYVPNYKVSNCKGCVHFKRTEVQKGICALTSEIRWLWNRCPNFKRITGGAE